MKTAAFLILVMWFNGGSLVTRYHEFPDMAECLVALKEVKINVSHGAESEGMAVAYCAHERAR